MTDFIKKLFKREFVKNFSFLFTGTVFVEAIRFLLSPVFSRLYTPADFGTFGTMAATIGVLSIGFTLKYEVAVVLPEKKNDAFSLVICALSSVVFFSFIVFILMLLFRNFFSELIFKGNVVPFYLLYISIGAMIASLASVFKNWFVFLKEFKLYATVSVLTIITNSIVKLVLGLIGVGVPGLIASHFAGFFFAVLFMAVHLFVKHKDVIKETTFDLIKKNAIKYKNYPLYTAPQSFINSFSQQLPMFFLTPAYGADVTGNYFFAFTLVGMPLTMISQSFKNVFYKKLSEIHNAGKDLFEPVFKSTLTLFAIAIVPFSLLFILSPYVFPVFLGDVWVEAGYYARYISIWVFFGFSNVPSMVALHVKMKQNTLFIYEIISTFLRCSFFIFFVSSLSPGMTVFFYSILGGILNLSIILFTLYFLRKKNEL